MKTIVSGLAVGAALLASVAAASAQAPADEKLIGDWRVSCNGQAAQAPCQMLQIVANKTTGAQVMVVSVVYLPANDVHLMQIFLPLGASLPRGVELKGDCFNSPKLPFSRCEQGGCVVVLPLNKEGIQNLSKAGESTQVVFAFDGGKDVNVHMSLKGFADADENMAEQAKAKAKSAPPAQSAPSVIK